MAREMKDSGVAWIGEIPADWSLKRIKFLHNEEPDSFIDGDWIESPYITDFGIRYLTTGNVGDGMFKRQGTGYITDKTFKELNCKYAYPGDLVISRLNAPYGRACILPSDEEKYVLAVDIVILRTDENKTFLCYLTQCEGYQNVVQDGAKGTTMKRISRTNLGNVVLPIPPRTVQDTIVDFLNIKCAEIDSVLAKTRTSIDEYKKLKQAIITQAVTKGVRGDRPMKESGIAWIGSIPSEWDVSTLGKFIAIDSGISIGRKYELGTPLVEVPYLRVANVQGDHLDLSDVATIMVTPEEAEKYRLKAGQLLMTEGGDRDKLGRGCLWNGEIENCIHQNHVFSVQTDDRLTVRYLDYLTTSEVARVYFDVTAKKTTNLACTSKSTIQKFVIPIPPVTEQRAICNYLDEKCQKLDKVLQKKESIIRQLDSYKKSVIYEYVTGKKEVQQKQQVKEMVVYPFFPAVFQATNSRFAQAILMSKVLDACKVKMGRVKLEKMMFVLENSIGFDFDTEYVREAAGPLDKSIYECEQIISRRNKWFTIRKSQHGVSYKPTSEHSKYKKYYAQYFSDYEDAINKVISIFNDFDADQAEVIATLYGAWNDCIIDKRSYTDNDIVDEVLNHWHPKKRRFPKDMWLRAIQRMRELDLIPHGYGRHTVIKQN